ncbi:hypothetical protein ACHHYP_20154 [Achlya hypogyna]|uniref:Uncharacterized protein n=1 Tax=Achlya hypogyna TaxID=1202772 RepID=A0A1V9Z2T4_ACHHY|nr:hypothetical protein ACHHYP_20154 [Achlya hypogyna]
MHPTSLTISHDAQSLISTQSDPPARPPAIAIEDLTALSSKASLASTLPMPQDFTPTASLRPHGAIDDALWPLPESVSAGYSLKQTHLLHGGLHHRLWSSKGSLSKGSSVK